MNEQLQLLIDLQHIDLKIHSLDEKMHIIPLQIEELQKGSDVQKHEYEVKVQATKGIEKGKRAPGGFMLAAGCTISPLTPSYNYWVMQKALEDFGWYD